MKKCYKIVCSKNSKFFSSCAVGFLEKEYKIGVTVSADKDLCSNGFGLFAIDNLTKAIEIREDFIKSGDKEKKVIFEAVGYYQMKLPSKVLLMSKHKPAGKDKKWFWEKIEDEQDDFEEGSLMFEKIKLIKPVYIDSNH